MSHCSSCSRSDSDSDMDDVILFHGIHWCPHCARVKEDAESNRYILLPSPGRMSDVNRDDPLDAWIDCYEMKPKTRILIKKAKIEVLRAWENWSGDKNSSQAKFMFFGWLNRHRPYFLTFRSKGDPWQTVHSWLIQYESGKSQKS